ncbi:hypothetical protein COBT_000928 [Conglomerata obtusa]
MSFQHNRNIISVSITSSHILNEKFAAQRFIPYNIPKPRFYKVCKEYMHLEPATYLCRNDFVIAKEENGVFVYVGDRSKLGFGMCYVKEICGGERYEFLCFEDMCSRYVKKRKSTRDENANKGDLNDFCFCESIITSGSYEYGTVPSSSSGKNISTNSDLKPSIIICNDSNKNSNINSNNNVGLNACIKTAKNLADQKNKNNRRNTVKTEKTDFNIKTTLKNKNNTNGAIEECFEESLNKGSRMDKIEVERLENKKFFYKETFDIKKNSDNKTRQKINHVDKDIEHREHSEINSQESNLKDVNFNEQEIENNQEENLLEIKTNNSEISTNKNTLFLYELSKNVYKTIGETNISKSILKGKHYLLIYKKFYFLYLPEKIPIIKEISLKNNITKRLKIKNEIQTVIKNRESFEFKSLFTDFFTWKSFLMQNNISEIFMPYLNLRKQNLYTKFVFNIDLDTLDNLFDDANIFSGDFRIASELFTNSNGRFCIKNYEIYKIKKK